MSPPAGQIGRHAQGRDRSTEPELTLLGADGAGKSSWRRLRREPLPDRLFDPE
ncbi:MAG: hypothetical protein OXH52_06085 [Gammaproteobacteria bacterium]|nr:hypothetical protein [Gammaproteobacteria bacterium]